MKRAQISIEYLITIGIAIAMVIPLTLFAINYVQNHQQEVLGQQLYQVGSTIVESAQTVYYQGEPAKNTIVISLPQRLDSAIVYPNEIVFTYQSNAGTDTVAIPSLVNLTGTLPTVAGRHEIAITAQSVNVAIAVN